MGYITTYSKKKLDPTNVDADAIDIVDISHSLSLLCRANGHFPYFYSVAQHSINCANEAKARGYSKRVQLGCLLHDASEAYMSDITSPIKAILHDYLKFEEKLQNEIFNKWITPSLNDDELKYVCEIDDTVLYYEFLTLMGEELKEHKPHVVSALNLESSTCSIIENEFLSLFYSLTNFAEESVGIDWSHGKWLTVKLTNRFATMKHFSNIREICEYYCGINRILIDIPIGLPENAKEAMLRPDQSARNYLKVTNRKSSIFNVPFRQMVYSTTKADFWELRDNLGAKVTPQSFGITNSIRDVDDFLDSETQWKNKLLESHPECAFQALNFGNGLEYSKYTEEGIKQRVQILSKYVDNIESLMISVSKKEHPDILDALCLAVTAKLKYKTIPDFPASDSKGLKMQIIIADI